ncbi:actin cortical patch component Lsb4 [Schizosaccharomyces cryophilus OY26]|uniref:Actin cortical patch component Lsb4 n=1 Tax=Schizosaccharomyces cryophilus (strain OY26 / ATCC MYA-4695 / CBS 11777 / NBRC 106824 / NRRL Y48691) TaxID=653667 RepID=S9W220_SCHCR|nr:actin cortical patch component Lsb4 [Schizosaccharomyces cryophilus OY26]EPY54093.1 actin cortical patch component Lsb4 [Schizosaccharomyces cryophilus OY26]
MGLHNPLPASLKSECKKAGKILTSFVDPRQTLGAQEVIPPSVLTNAKGLVIMTVLKAGFLFSGRIGSGLIVARLDDGTWSAPSAVMTGGMGVGAQIGSELTDFVIILNSKSAVQTFARLGSITLGGNLSVAAGPLGRNAEAGGGASVGGMAPIFSYSKTKGLFAGVSLEGSVLVERRDANRSLYRGDINAKRLLTGQVPQPAAADPLYKVLNSKIFNMFREYEGDIYNDVPIYADEEPEDIWGSRDSRSRRDTLDSDSGYTSRRSQPNRNSRRYAYDDDEDDYDRLHRDRPISKSTTSSVRSPRAKSGGFRSQYTDTPTSTNEYYSDEDRSYNSYDDEASSGSSRFSSRSSDYSRPSRPSAPKPVFSKDKIGPNQVRAMYTFTGEQPGDLSFRKGDIIDIIQRSESHDDWWTGRIGYREGIFPANYVSET